MVVVEPPAASELQRDVHERQLALLDDLDGGTAAESRGHHGGQHERWRGPEGRGLRAVKGLLGVDGLRAEREAGCDGGGSRDTGGANHWAILRVAASSVLPCGTTLSVTRLVRRYWRTTRCTSAAVTAR